MNNRLLESGALALGLTAAACGGPSMAAIIAQGADCGTKECFLDAQYGAKKEGVQPNGSVVLCKEATPGVTADSVRKEARALFIQTHGCDDAGVNSKFDREAAGTHSFVEQINGDVRQQVNLACAYVDNTNFATMARCDGMEK